LAHSSLQEHSRDLMANIILVQTLKVVDELLVNRLTYLGKALQNFGFSIALINVDTDRIQELGAKWTLMLLRKRMP
jgi:hypothetical protein